ncbi:MAG: hypothetical protein OXF89_15895 [Rhodospirillaceae bacterium]|nr:hypothetical protein [Rhodospirillaceae bacterium]MCY4066728.1 hypothetical protein [Rhodospirillaceae bacterium]
MPRAVIGAGAGAVAAVLSAATGQAADFNSVTAPTVVEMLESQGLPVITGYRKPSGDPYVRTRASGIDYTILFYKCRKARRPRPCQHIMYMARYTLARPMSFRLMNEWNRRVHFQRGYLVRDKATGLWTRARLEMDVILAERGWVRAKTLLPSFIVFHRTNRRFYDLIRSRSGEGRERIPGAKEL